MKFHIFFLILCLIAVGCNSSELVSDSEKIAVQNVLDFYGGVCLRHKGFEVKNGKKETYFTLEISQSAILEQYSEFPELATSNIALLFYSNLK